MALDVILFEGAETVTFPGNCAGPKPAKPQSESSCSWPNSRICWMARRSRPYFCRRPSLLLHRSSSPSYLKHLGLKGYMFCFYLDLNVTGIACAALNGIKMGDKTLTVRRANNAASQPPPEQESILLQAQQQVQLQKLLYQVGSLPTTVCVTQVVSADELKDDVEYEDILDDMWLEAGKYGNLVRIVIPRPDPVDSQSLEL